MSQVIELYLPKDLINIVEDYTKDNTHYNKVIQEINKLRLSAIKLCDNPTDEIDFLESFVFVSLTFMDGF